MKEQQSTDLAMARNKIANAKNMAEAAMRSAERALSYANDCERLLERIARQEDEVMPAERGET